MEASIIILGTLLIGLIIAFIFRASYKDILKFKVNSNLSYFKNLQGIQEDAPSKPGIRDLIKLNNNIIDTIIRIEEGEEINGGDISYQKNKNGGDVAYQ